MADKPLLPKSAYSLPHHRIDRFATARAYRPPRHGMSARDNGRERLSHGGKLNAEFAQALGAAHRMLQARDDTIAAGKAGAYVEIASDTDEALPDKAWGQQGIRIAAVRVDAGGAQVGGLFVPQSAETFLTDTLADYTAGTAGPASTARIEQIGRIGAGTLHTLWVDRRPLPTDGEAIWWECWCWRDTAKHLARPATRLGLRISEQRLRFPDFEVIPVYATTAEMERLLANTDAIAELRHASDSPHVYTHDLAKYQVPLVKDLAARVTPAGTAAPTACILDTGVARAHPLLEASLAAGDCHAVDERWGKHDHYRGGHGTQMAGIALLGDLTYPVADQSVIELTHRLESVTLLPPAGFKATEPENFGIVTQAAIALPEIEAPDRARSFCLAVTNLELSGDRPTSWSAALDQAAAGVMPGERDTPEAPRRLVLVAAGNIQNDVTAADVRNAEKFPIEDPAQAWNALTIGGFTDRDTIRHNLYQGWTPVAPVGDRSPYSRTSVSWPDTAPVKPELVLEAGNRALSPAGTDVASELESMSLLSTAKDFVADPLTPFWATSAATAEATRLAATIQAAHPDIWPETVRALLVHSARWTPAMLGRFRGAKGRKAQQLALLREFGYGVPSLERALASAASDVALVSEATIQPFRRPTKAGKKGTDIGDGAPRFNEVHIYALPWPRSALETLSEKRVELKVTLSYFIEPSPGQYAPVTPARYRSHGLRFDLQRRTETASQFEQRINDLAEAGEGSGTTADDIEIASEADKGWMFGANSRAQRSAGSLHCDVWQGTGADLAARRTIAVYPVNGWWRTRVPQKRYDSATRYALVMTLTCIDEDIDLHAEIAAEIVSRVAASVEP